MRRISLPATPETEELVRMSQRLDEMVTRLHQQIDRLPLVLARRQMDQPQHADEHAGQQVKEVDCGPDRGPEEGRPGPDR